MLHVQTLGEIEREFRDDVADRVETLRCFVDQDVLALDAIAAILAKACRDIAPLVASLDSAALNPKADPFSPAMVDEYALVEGLLWDQLSPGAEKLLKAQVKEALRFPALSGPKGRELVASFDDGCVQ
jgi:hypothetical protein